MKTRCNECKVSEEVHSIPVKQIKLPPPSRLIRQVDELFLERLIVKMQNDESGSYEPIIAIVKDLDSRQMFDVKKKDEYEYEVIGGIHNTTAAQKLSEKYPTRHQYRVRHAHLYVGLSNDEALWLAARHNVTGGFRHNSTFKDEVYCCRSRLFLGTGKNMDKDEPDNAEKEWRDNCSLLLSKSKKLLSEVFSIALLPAGAWQHFMKICQLYAKCGLKDQKLTLTEITEGPTIKAVYFRCLSGLSQDHKMILLQKVSEGQMSLSDLKSAANEVRKLRPVQDAILNMLSMQSWIEVEIALGNEVLPEKLTRFMDANLEGQDFIQFLHRLKKLKEIPEGIGSQQSSTESAVDIFIHNCDENTTAKGHLCLQTDMSSRQFSDRDPNFVGIFFTITHIGLISNEEIRAFTENAVNVTRTANFSTVMTNFNVCVMSVVSQANIVKEVLESLGATTTEGFIFVKGKKSKDPIRLTSAVLCFIVGHWSVTGKVSRRHLNFTKDEVRDNCLVVDHDNIDDDDLPLEAYMLLIKRLSDTGDYVLDIDSTGGKGFAAGLLQGRNAFFIEGNGYQVDVDLLRDSIGNFLKAPCYDEQESESDKDI